MARDSSGPKNQPRYDALGIPADAADLTEISEYAAANGNRKALTSTQRLALTGADRWVGLEVFETDTQRTYEYQSGGWVLRTYVAGGYVSASTDGSGYVTVNHGLGRAPVGVVATIDSASPVIVDMLKCEVSAPYTATTFRVRIRRADQGNGPFAGNPVAFQWMAMA